MLKSLEPVQNPIIRNLSIVEAIWQTGVLGIAVIATYYFSGFQIALLTCLVIGFGFLTMNIMAAATSTNVQIAEVRDIFKKEDLMDIIRKRIE